MKNSRPLVGALAVALVVLFGPTSGAVFGQQRLPADIYGATPPLSPEQKEALRTYVEANIQALLSGEDQPVSDARDQLEDPLTRPGISTGFRDAYTKAVVERLAGAVESDVLIVRLNAMIVLTKLSGEGVVVLIASGLSDQSPAVRYWAALAVAKIAKPGVSDPVEFTADQQRQVLVHLEKALSIEVESAVLAELLKALNALEVPEAKQTLLKVLNARVRVHVQEPLAIYRPEHDALQEMFTALVRQFAEGTAQIDQTRLVAQAACRYMTLAATQLNAFEQVSDEIKEDHSVMVRLGDEVLRYVIDQVLVGTEQPKKIDNAIRIGDWGFVLEQANRWRSLLMGHPFSFNEDELRIEE